jgi:ABC-type transport system substrate-binding protein
METQREHCRNTHGVSRRELLQAGLAAGMALSAWPWPRPQVLWAAEAGQPKRGGILRVRGYDPPHFDHQLVINFKADTTLSFVYSRLMRHKVGTGVQPGTFIVEPDLAERWEALDDTTYVFHLRKGVRWHNKPPVNGRELVAEDVKFTYDRFLTEKANPRRFLLDPVDRVEVVDRYTVKFVLKEPFVWLIDTLASPFAMWIIAPEVVDKFGDLKKPETAIGTGPFLLERYEPNVKTVFTRNPDYFRQGQPYVDGVEWLVLEDPATGLAMYRTGQIDCGPAAWWSVRLQDLDSVKKSIPTWCIRISCPTSPMASTCEPIIPPSTTSGCGAPSRMPSTGRRSLTRYTSGVNRHQRSPAACPRGLPPSMSSARGRNTISTIRRRPGVCWRKLAFRRA